MAASPIATIIILTLAMIFQALLAGEEYFSDSFGGLEEAEEECDEPTPFGPLVCFYRAVVHFVKTIGAFVKFIFKFTSFDVFTSEAPWPIRVFFTTVIVALIVWSVATLIRGN